MLEEPINGAFEESACFLRLELGDGFLGVRLRLREGSVGRVTLLVFAVTLPTRAETHRFEPKVFYNTFSGAHPPALRIKPGDRVNTYTIDAGGKDATGTQRGSSR